jgi:hypothetical protein
MVARLYALRAGRLLPPGMFLVLISVRGWVDPRAAVRLEALGQLKKSYDLIGIRTRDLSACSIVYQSITLPRAPSKKRINNVNKIIPVLDTILNQLSPVHTVYLCNILL